MIIPGTAHLRVKTWRRVHILHLDIIHPWYVGYGRNHLWVFIVVQYIGNIFPRYEELSGQGRPASILLLLLFLTEESGVFITFPMTRLGF